MQKKLLRQYKHPCELRCEKNKCKKYIFNFFSPYLSNSLINYHRFSIEFVASQNFFELGKRLIILNILLVWKTPLTVLPGSAHPPNDLFHPCYFEYNLATTACSSAICNCRYVCLTMRIALRDGLWQVERDWKSSTFFLASKPCAIRVSAPIPNPWNGAKYEPAAHSVIHTRYTVFYHLE